MNINKKIDRREFIKDVSLAGLGITFGASLMGANVRTSSAQNTSKLVIASHSTDKYHSFNKCTFT